MFEFAISQHQKHPPSRRFLACSVVSAALHLVAVLLLIRFPWLLSPGLSPWFRQPSLLLSMFSHSLAQEGQDSQWRVVTVVGKSGGGKMVAPSAATLRQYVYDWSKHAGEGAPPVHVRWGNEKNPLSEAEATKPKPVPEPKPAETAAAEAAKGSGDDSGGNAAVQVADAGTGGAKGTVYLPAPKPATGPPPSTKAAETSPVTAPSSIPSGVKQPVPAATPPAPKPAAPAQAKPPVKVFEDEQKAIRSQESGLFDTNGFPLGEYANLIIERVKGNWMIPSNLRNSQGRTTVIFYIDREGRFNNAHIVTSSGSSSLDLAALNAVIESNPFPPLPKGFPGDHVGAKFVFSYNERQ